MKNWLINKIGSTALTIILTVVLTSVIGMGGTYFMGFLTAPSDIDRLNENRKRDSAIVVKKFDSLTNVLIIYKKWLEHDTKALFRDSIDIKQIKNKLNIKPKQNERVNIPIYKVK